MGCCIYIQNLDHLNQKLDITVIINTSSVCYTSTSRPQQCSRHQMTYSGTRATFSPTTQPSRAQLVSIPGRSSVDALSTLCSSWTWTRSNVGNAQRVLFCEQNPSDCKLDFIERINVIRERPVKTLFLSEDSCLENWYLMCEPHCLPGKPIRMFCIVSV